MATTTATTIGTDLGPVFALVRGLAILFAGAAICGGILLVLEPRRHVATLGALAASLALAAAYGSTAQFFVGGAALACAIAAVLVLRGAAGRRCVIVAAEVLLFDPDGRAKAEVLREVGAKGVLHVPGPAGGSAFGRGPTLTRLFVPCCTEHAEHAALLERLRGIPGVIDVRLPGSGVPAAA